MFSHGPLKAGFLLALGLLAAASPHQDKKRQASSGSSPGSGSGSTAGSGSSSSSGPGSGSGSGSGSGAGIIHRDLVIVGGGASGTHAAWRSIENGSLSISVIEASDRLGGHVDTFYDPATGLPIEYGAQAFINNDQTQEFFGRFDVSLNTSSTSPFQTYVADFKAGVVIPNATNPDPFSLIGPITDYLGVLSTNFPFLSEGAYDLPDPVPEDLLIPFGQFVSKYNISEVVPVIFTFAHGVGNMLEVPTLRVLQNFGTPHILGLASGYMYAPSGNQALYDAVADWLGDSVIYNTKVASTTRNQDGTTTLTLTNGQVIEAEKVLITIPPTLDNLAGFDLDDQETCLFKQWTDVPYYIGVTTQTGLPDLTNFVNFDTSAVGNLPSVPYVFRLETDGVSGYQKVKVIGEPDCNKAQDLVYDAVSKIDQSLASLDLGDDTGPADDIFAAWELHEHLNMYVSSDSIRSGFYKKLYALQGRHNTYWTGNAWASDYAPLLWAFNDNRILPLVFGINDTETTTNRAAR